jgi:predicted ATP-grasp superfamily ATP-dependent carboligase
MGTTDKMSALVQPVPKLIAVPKANRTVGAVVLGGDYQGLGIVRSLGRQGVPVCVVDDELSISRYSRYTTKFEKAADLRNERATVDSLLEIGKRLGLNGWILYPTREELVAALSRHRSELSQFFRVPTPEWEIVKWAWDKRNTYRLANELDIPTPATFCPENVDQLDQLDSLQPPFAIKPAIKEHFVYATKAKAWLANSHEEFRTLFQKASEFVPCGEIMGQELIPGGGSQQFSYCAFFRDYEAVGKMVVRRRRQHPLQFGRASTYVETLDIPILEEYSERFLRAIDYYGLVELEYKLDPRDSQFKLLDVNARTWGYHSLGGEAGVDFSYMLYADQVGLPVSVCKGRPGVGWVRTTTDIPAALMGILSGDTNLTSCLSSLRKCNAEAVFSLSDPVPGLAEVALIPYLAIKRGF